MKIGRKDFLKAALALGAGAAAPARAGSSRALDPDRKGVLVDTTVCVGCRRCEFACKTAHDMPTPPIESYDDSSAFDAFRRPDTSALTVVNRFDAPKRPDFPYMVKSQCMHCEHPACLSVCIVGAFSKKPSGAVVWDTDKCIGCRYCMVACPFQVPSFEFGKAIQPRIMKCDFCDPRQEKGLLPACVEACPVEALTFGRREDILRTAWDRIKKAPARYEARVFGEREVGGTSWFYIGGRPAEELGFPRLGEDPAPGVVETIQHGIFAYFVPPVALYGLLGIMMKLMKSEPGGGQEE